MVTLTSPGIDKPEPSSDKYDDVHVVGSRYGQDLKQSTVEAMLKGEVRSPFQGLIDFLGPLGEGLANIVMAIPNLVVDGLAWAVGEITKAFQSGSNPVPYPQSAVFPDIPVKLNAALDPLREVLQQSQKKAEDALGDAKELNDMMEAEFDKDPEYAKLGSLQLKWNKFIMETDEAQNASIEALGKADDALGDSVKALSLAAARSGRIVVADREQAVNDGYVRVDNPRNSSSAYVTARDGVAKWYGNITVITQWREDSLLPRGGGYTMVRSGWVEEGKLVGKSNIYLNRTGGHIEHTIAIYSEIPKEDYLEYKESITVDNH